MPRAALRGPPRCAPAEPCVQSSSAAWRTECKLPRDDARARAQRAAAMAIAMGALFHKGRSDNREVSATRPGQQGRLPVTTTARSIPPGENKSHPKSAALGARRDRRVLHQPARLAERTGRWPYGQYRHALRRPRRSARTRAGNTVSACRRTGARPFPPNRRTGLRRISCTPDLWGRGQFAFPPMPPKLSRHGGATIADEDWAPLLKGGG